MLSKQTRVKDIIALVKVSLSTIYGKNELNSITYLLLEHFLHLSKTESILQSDKLIDSSTIHSIEEAIQVLKNYTPIQHVIGKAYFFNLELFVDKNVLIPRQETEELVKWVIDDLKQMQYKTNNIEIIDIGTGSGCIAIAIKQNFKSANVYAIDISENALNIAKKNSTHNNVNINYIKLDILSENILSIDNKFDIIVSNPPYIAENEKGLMHKNVLNFEPHQALFVKNEEPLLFYDAIIKFAMTNLKINGKLYFEINEKHGIDLVNILKKYHFKQIILKKDLNNKDRMISAEKY